MEGYDIISGSGLNQIKRELDEAPEEVVTWLQDTLTEKFGVQFDR
jgi:hypothetical protein